MKDSKIEDLLFFGNENEIPPEIKNLSFNKFRRLDNKIISIIYPKKLIIFDVDGTIDGDVNGEYISFQKIDNQIINELFNECSLVMKFNNMLWKINELDFISNSMFIFTLRMCLYSIIAGRNTKKVLEYYQKRYIEISKIYILKKYYQEILKLENLGFKVVIFSHNLYTEGISDALPIKAVKNKRKCIKCLAEVANIAYVIGNNYMDDIYISQKLGIKTIYVGNSKVVKKIARKGLIVVSKTKEAINFIKENKK